MWQVKRIIIDCLHEENLTISNNLDKLNQIIILCKNYFPNVNINPNANLLHLSAVSVNPTNLIIDGNRVLLDINDPPELKEVYKIYLDVIKTLSTNLEINEYKRIGVRYFSAEFVNNTIDIDLLISKLFVNPEFNKDNFYGEIPNNFHFGFSTNYEEYKINHNFSKLSNQNINVSQGKIETKIDNYKLYDIDFYKDTITKSEKINLVLKEAENKIELLSSEYFAKTEG